MFTIVYTAADNGEQFAYGNFKTGEAAERRRQRMERDLDAGRDASGGGVGDLQVVKVCPLWSWETDEN